MRTQPSPPFLQADPGAVEAEQWLLGDEPLPAVMVDWDPDLDLSLTRRVVIDGHEIRDSAGLPAAAALSMTVRWQSDSTRMGGATTKVLPPPARRQTQEVTIRVLVPGARAGGTLMLQTLILLHAECSTGSRLSARRPGSILWQDTTTVALEGGAARFPMSPTSFSALGHLPDGAWWFLEAPSTSLDAPFLQAVRVLVNTDIPGLMDALQTDGGSPQAAAVVSFLSADVSRALIGLGLESADPLVPEEIEPDSLGAAIVAAITSVWPGEHIPSLVERWRSERPRMEAQIQDRLRLKVMP